MINQQNADGLDRTAAADRSVMSTKSEDVPPAAALPVWTSLTWSSAAYTILKGLLLGLVVAKIVSKITPLYSQLEM